MTWQLLLQGFLPLLVFAVVDTFASFRTAVIAAVVFAIAEAAWMYFQYGEVDEMTWIALALVLVFGFAAYRLDNSKIFKFQPVILGVCFAAVVAYFQFFDQPILLKFLPRMKHMLPPENFAMLESPEMLHKMSIMSGQMILVFLIHAALVAFAALRLSTAKWLIIRGIGLYVILAMFIFADRLVWAAG